MKFNEAHVGMKVRPVHAEMAQCHRDVFKEDKDYVIQSFVDERLFRVVDDNGMARALLPKRFRPSRVKVEGVFEPGDKVWYSPHMEQPVYLRKIYTIKRVNGDKVSLEEVITEYKANLWVHAEIVEAAPVPKKVVEPVWPELDEELMDKLTKASRGGVCNYALKNTAGRADVLPNAACHYRLSGGAITGKVHTLACNVSSHYKELEKDIKPLYVQHTEYVLKESPWAKYFHERDIKKVLEGGVFMDVSHPHNHVVTACIALRMGHEHFPARKLMVFARAIELGYNKHIAFIVAHTTITNDAGNVVPYYNNGWHHCINSDHDAKELCEFFQKGYTRGMDQEPTKNGLIRYEIQNTVAPSNTGNAIKHVYAKANGSRIEKDKWGEDVLIPVQGFDESLKSLCDTLVPYFK